MPYLCLAIKKKKTNAFDFSQSSSFKMSEKNYKDLKETIKRNDTKKAF